MANAMPSFFPLAGLGAYFLYGTFEGGICILLNTKKEGVR